MRRFLSVGPLLLCTMLFAGQACAQYNFSAIAPIVNQGIANHKLPGAVVIVGHDGKVVFRQAFGMRSLVPDREKMTVDTIFDMASLTKVIATAPAVMQLYQEGKISADALVAQYLPAFAANGKGDITIRDLLTHYSGLIPDLPLIEPWYGKQAGYSSRSIAYRSVRRASASSTATSTLSCSARWWRRFPACR